MEYLLLIVVVSLFNLVVFYFVIKAAIKNAIYDQITDPKKIKSLVKFVQKTISEQSIDIEKK